MPPECDGAPPALAPPPEAYRVLHPPPALGVDGAGEGQELPWEAATDAFVGGGVEVSAAAATAESGKKSVFTVKERLLPANWQGRETPNCSIVFDSVP